MNEPKNPIKFQKKRKIIAVIAVLSGALLLHFTSQLVNIMYINFYLHTKLIVIPNFGLIIARPANLSLLNIQQIAFLSVLPFLSGIFINEVSMFLLKTKNEEFRSFILFLQLVVSSYIMFGVFLFIFCIVFEVRLFSDWYILASYFHGRYEYKLLTAFLSAALTFSYSGMSLNRLRNYFSNNNDEGIQTKNAKTNK